MSTEITDIARLPKAAHCRECGGSGTVGTGIAEASNTLCAHCEGMGIEPRRLTGYGQCKCLLTKYCDGLCNPIYADAESSDPAPVTAIPVRSADKDCDSGHPSVTELTALLPGTYYMEPPDGGSVTLLDEQGDAL